MKHLIIIALVALGAAGCTDSGNRIARYEANIAAELKPSNEIATQISILELDENAYQYTLDIKFRGEVFTRKSAQFESYEAAMVSAVVEINSFFDERSFTYVYEYNQEMERQMAFAFGER